MKAYIHIEPDPDTDARVMICAWCPSKDFQIRYRIWRPDVAAILKSIHTQLDALGVDETHTDDHRPRSNQP